jgi:hypothetical protein
MIDTTRVKQESAGSRDLSMDLQIELANMMSGYESTF